jgi:hypothetical protein
MKTSTSLLQHWLRPWLATVAVLVCTTCSEINVAAFKVVYEHADWLAQRMIGRYVDLSQSQAQILRTQLERLHRWHRTQELPLYASMLDDAAERVARRLTAEDAAWMLRFVNERRQALGSRMADELAPVLLTLTPDQRSQIAENLARDNARYAHREIDPGREKTVETRTDWLARQMEHWTGELTAAQRSRVRVVSAATAELPEARLSEHRRRQRAFLQLIGAKPDEPALHAVLASLVAAPRAEADESYRHVVMRYEEELVRMLLDVDRGLSPRQRVTAVARLHRFAQELRELATDQL